MGMVLLAVGAAATVAVAVASSARALALLALLLVALRLVATLALAAVAALLVRAFGIGAGRFAAALVAVVAVAVGTLAREPLGNRAIVGSVILAIAVGNGRGLLCARGRGLGGRFGVAGLVLGLRGTWRPRLPLARLGLGEPDKSAGASGSRSRRDA